MSSVCRGVRGATTADSNSEEHILQATMQLLALMIRKNAISPQDVASVIFTTTPDLNATFPAVAARRIGWLDVPLMCMNEIDVAGSRGLPLCVRILIHWNTDRDQSDIEHVYVKNAALLRPEHSSQLSEEDLAELERWIQQTMREN